MCHDCESCHYVSWATGDCSYFRRCATPTAGLRSHRTVRVRGEGDLPVSPPAAALPAAARRNGPDGAAMAADCYHVFVDVGANIGLHARYLFEPQHYPLSTYVTAFGRLLGPPRQRNLSEVCAFVVEPNPAHAPRLRELETSYQNCGWRLQHLPLGASDRAGEMRFYPNAEAPKRQDSNPQPCNCTIHQQVTLHGPTTTHRSTAGGAITSGASAPPTGWRVLAHSNSGRCRSPRSTSQHSSTASRRGGCPASRRARDHRASSSRWTWRGSTARAKCPLGSAPARLLHLLRARLAALGNSHFQEEADPLGPATASGARASRLQSPPILPLVTTQARVQPAASVAAAGRAVRRRGRFYQRRAAPAARARAAPPRRRAAHFEQGRRQDHLQVPAGSGGGRRGLC